MATIRVAVVVEEDGIETARAYGEGPTFETAAAVATNEAKRMFQKASRGNGR